MISNAWATMRTARSFLPLLRPFIIKLFRSSISHLLFPSSASGNAPVDQSLDNGHLGLLELLLGISSSGVGHVDGVSDLDVISEGDVLHLNTVHKLSTIGQ